MGWERGGCRGGGGLRNATRHLGFKGKSSHHADLLDAQKQKLKNCPLPSGARARGSISSAAAGTAGAAGEPRARPGARRAGNEGPAEPGPPGHGRDSAMAEHGCPRPSSSKRGRAGAVPAGNRAHGCRHDLSARLGKPRPENEIRSN